MTKFKSHIILFILLIFFSNSKAEVINSVEINGNERIAKETILVLSNISTGDDLDEFKINEVVKNLYETNFFKNINIDLKNGVLT